MWVAVGRAADDEGMKLTRGENDLRVVGRTEMDGIAQSKSYKRTSFCYLKERPRRVLRKKWRGRERQDEGGRTDGETEEQQLSFKRKQTARRTRCWTWSVGLAKNV